eukprot:s64_g30.t2
MQGTPTFNDGIAKLELSWFARVPTECNSLTKHEMLPETLRVQDISFDARAFEAQKRRIRICLALLFIRNEMVTFRLSLGARQCTSEEELEEQVDDENAGAGAGFASAVGSD